MNTPRTPHLVAVANARIPGFRAHSIQMVQNAAALNRCGTSVELVAPQRSGTGRGAPSSRELGQFYGVRRPAPMRRIWSLDLIDRVPLAMQRPAFLLQASTFSVGVRKHLTSTPWRWLYLRDPHTLFLLTKAHPQWLEHITYEAHGLPFSTAGRHRLASLVRGLGRVIVLNQHLEQEYLRLGVPPERLMVEPAAAVGDGSPSMDLVQARTSLDLPASRPILCYTGSLTAAKGVETLIQTAKMLPEQWIVLLIGGDRRQQEWARRLMASEHRIRLVGRVEPAAVKKYLAAADVHVLPNSSTDPAASLWTSPMKLFESASVGRPVVLSDVPALRMAADLLPESCPVNWCTPDNPAALASAVQNAASSTPLNAEDHPNDGWRERAERILASLPPGRPS